MAIKKRKKTGILNSKLLRAGYEFDSLRLWETLDFDETIAFMLPDEEHPIFATVMGQAGEEFGMTYTSGPHGLWNLRQLLYPERSEKKVREMITMWGMTLAHKNELPPELKRAIKASPVKRPTGAKVPWILIKEPGKLGRHPTKREQEIMLYCLAGLMKHFRAEGQVPMPLHTDEGVLTLTLSGPTEDPDIAVDIRTYPVIPPDDSRPAILPPQAVRNAPRIKAQWIVGFPIMPAGIEGDDRELRLLLVVDADSGMVLHVDSLFAEQLDKAAGSLFDLIQGKGRSPAGPSTKGLPEEIIFADETLLDTLSPAMKALGVECGFDDSLPEWTEAVEGLASFMVKGR